MISLKFSKLKKIIKFYLFLSFKIIAYSLPIKYSFRKNFFGRNGRMDNINYCKKVFKKHVIDLKVSNESENLLEIGPGDSCYTIILALKNKFKHITLIDKNTDEIINSIKNLSLMNLKVKSNFSSDNLTKLIVNGEKKLIEVKIIKEDFKSIPEPLETKYDLIFSNAVLQHMDRNQINNLLEFCKKISNPNCIYSHQIRFTDHITGKKQSFEHYNCPKIIWDSNIFKKFPFWTNRIYLEEYIKIFKSFGLTDKNYKNIKKDKLFENYHFILK